MIGQLFHVKTADNCFVMGAECLWGGGGGCSWESVNFSSRSMFGRNIGCLPNQERFQNMVWRLMKSIFIFSRPLVKNLINKHSSKDKHSAILFRIILHIKEIYFYDPLNQRLFNVHIKRIPIIQLLLFTPFRVFHTSVSHWFLTEVWVTAILLKSPGLFSVFWPILTMQ